MKNGKQEKDDLYIYNNGKHIITLNASGTATIGTKTPAQALDVYNDHEQLPHINNKRARQQTDGCFRLEPGTLLFNSLKDVLTTINETSQKGGTSVTVHFEDSTPAVVERLMKNMKIVLDERGFICRIYNRATLHMVVYW